MNEKKSLNEIANFFQTDKRECNHDYIPFYSLKLESLRDVYESVLEIGVYDSINMPYDAASLRMWREYFSKSTIYGIDINDFLYLNDEPRFKIFKADQSNREQMISVFENINRSIDLIIDDGGHMMHQQQISLGVIFPYLKSGGIYVIEDLHTSYDFNNFYYADSSDKSTLSILEEFNKTKKITSSRLSLGERLYLEENIKSCEIFKGKLSEIAFLTKK